MAGSCRRLLHGPCLVVFRDALSDARRFPKKIFKMLAEPLSLDFSSPGQTTKLNGQTLPYGDPV